MNNCDNCSHYNWYYDWCDKWKCNVDSRSHYNCFSLSREFNRKNFLNKSERTLDGRGKNTKRSVKIT